MDPNISSSSKNVSGKGTKKGGEKSVSNQSEKAVEKYRAPRDKEFTRQETDLLVLLVGERLKARSNRNESSLNPTAEEWNYIRSQFNYRTTQNNRSLQVLKNRWKTLKSNFSVFKELASRSGNGWNEAEGIPDVAPEIWDRYIEHDEKKYKPFRKKKFPWFRAMEDLCGSNIATCDRQITSDLTIPITRNFNSDSSESDRNEEFSAESVEVLPESEQVQESEQVTFNDNTIHHTSHTSSPISPPLGPSAETEHGRSGSAIEKHKRVSAHADSSRNSKKNAVYRKAEIAHTFLSQQQSRNESLDKMANNLQKNPKYGGVQKEVIDKLKATLDTISPIFHSDYYDMLAVLGNDWVQGCFMNEADDMLKGYINHILHRYHAGLPLIPDLGGSVPHHPSSNPIFMPFPYGASNGPMPNAPSHFMHHLPSQMLPSMTASPVANSININCTPVVNVNDEDHATPCTPSSNLQYAASDLNYSWT